MGRFVIRHDSTPAWRRRHKLWQVIDGDGSVAASFDTLAEAEAYVIERAARAER
jgi:hypothetical protein